jgi:hypothetical protein
MGVFHAKHLSIFRNPSAMFFRSVTPYSAFVNGCKVTVENLNVTSIYDDLVENVTFRYILADANNQWAGEGVFKLGPDTYDDWDSSEFNAYEIVAKGVGLTLLQTGGVTNPEA